MLYLTAITRFKEVQRVKCNSLQTERERQGDSSGLCYFLFVFWKQTKRMNTEKKKDTDDRILNYQNTKIKKKLIFIWIANDKIWKHCRDIK